MEYTNCNLCKNNQALLLFEIPDYLLENFDIQTRLVKCEGCGLIYQNPRPPLEVMGIHYPPSYVSYNEGKKLISASWLKKQEAKYGLRKRWLPILKRRNRGKILDVGCATGEFLGYMTAKPNWELYGVEIDENAAHEAERRHSIKVFQGFLEQAQFPDNFFDVVTMWEVLEHLHDPRNTLLEIHRILKPDGLLILRVPNFGSPLARIFGRYWAGLDAPRHLYVFTLQTLESMLKKTGFQIQEANCKLGSYGSSVLSVFFLLAGLNVSRRVRKLVRKILQNPITSLLSSPIFYLFSIGAWGPSLTVVSTSKSLDNIS
jgi:SAM-dependent methyltransferase